MIKELNGEAVQSFIEWVNVNPKDRKITIEIGGDFSLETYKEELEIKTRAWDGSIGEMQHNMKHANEIDLVNVTREAKRFALKRLLEAQERGEI